MQPRSLVQPHPVLSAEFEAGEPQRKSYIDGKIHAGSKSDALWLRVEVLWREFDV